MSPPLFLLPQVTRGFNTLSSPFPPPLLSMDWVTPWSQKADCTWRRSRFFFFPTYLNFFFHGYIFRSTIALGGRAYPSFVPGRREGVAAFSLFSYLTASCLFPRFPYASQPPHPPPPPPPPHPNLYSFNCPIPSRVPSYSLSGSFSCLMNEGNILTRRPTGHIRMKWVLFPGDIGTFLPKDVPPSPLS